MSLSLDDLLSCWRTACAMGIIMAVEAVLLIHMDRKAVTNMKPSINLRIDRQSHWCSNIPSGSRCPDTTGPWCSGLDLWELTELAAPR